jgi:UDP-glucose 4-epimerase
VQLVFSSSAVVYGSPKDSPCREEFPLTPNSLYKKTKLVVENICGDIYSTCPKWKIVLFRNFNPVGAHLSGYLGEDPGRMPNYFMSYAQQVAIGRRPSLIVLENGYATIDGAG